MNKVSKFMMLLVVVCCFSCGDDGDDDKNQGTTETPTIPTPVKKYSIGDYYNLNGVTGVVYQITEDSLHGKIVSMDENVLPWCSSDSKIKTNANRNDSCLANMDIIRSLYNMDDYPAF
jgi:hypothetical protein